MYLICIFFNNIHIEHALLFIIILLFLFIIIIKIYIVICVLNIIHVSLHTDMINVEYYRYLYIIKHFNII